jgi:o-succinylbenzoate---CoA ligase
VAALSTSPEAQGQRVPDFLRWRARVSPGALALKVGPLEWSYRELQERVSALAAVLLSRGVGRGDRVALLMQPSESYVALVHAVARLGAVVVPLNHRQSTQELRGQLRDSGPSLIVHDGAFGGLAKELAGRRAEARAPASELVAESPSGMSEPSLGQSVDVSAPHAIVYTSGSSGAPKGVELTLSNLVWNAISVGLRVGASSADRWLLCLPLFHVGGYTVLFRSLFHGSGIVLHQSFDPKRVSLSLDDDGITLASFVPTMLGDVLRARGGKPLGPRLRFVFLGGGQPQPHLIAEIRRRHLPVLLTYGMTETCSQVAVSDDWGSADGLALHPAFPSEVAVTKAGAGRRVEPAGPGEVGEVAVRGPSVFRGYWRNPALTNARFRDGWFLTGDLGVLRPGTGLRGRGTGGVVILGRKEEMIISGGEKVFPAEVEAALREHPAVEDAVVLGLKDARWGERVVAVVETKAGLHGARPSGDELAAFLKERVGRYNVPKQYYFLPELPRSPTGKTRRAEVRSLLERGGDAG